MSKLKIITGIMFVVVVFNALAVVYVKQQSRDLYAEVRKLQKLQDDLVIEWGKLQLQHSTLTNPNYVEQVAQKKLKMTSVNQPEYVVLKP